MTTTSLYDVAIVGGGLAGLALSIQLARWGHQVIVFEKETYPFHRVCGEYISLESWDFMKELGVDPTALGVSQIDKLLVTGTSGRKLLQNLPLGGFGVSRYLLDHTLAKKAMIAGVQLMENTRVTDITTSSDTAIISTHSQTYQARVACACFGKRSNLDIKWERPFTLAAKKNHKHYVGVKYHAQLDFAPDTIALHMFSEGYCGVVRIEGGKYNVCYLTTASNLRRSGNSIEKMEASVLSKNPHLKKIFSQGGNWRSDPVTISQISFANKTQVENHLLMVGDAAGMITPLCGNGMSMAFHGSKIAANLITQFLNQHISRDSMEANYTLQWQQHFSRRLRVGRQIQQLAGHPQLTSLVLNLGTVFPRLFQSLVRQTHGKPF